MTVHVTCTQTAFRVHKNSCSVDFSEIPHRPSHFMNTRTTTTKTFLISNTVVPNPYSHSRPFHTQSFTPLLKFQVCLMQQICLSLIFTHFTAFKKIMALSCVLTAFELEFSRISLWSMVSMLDLLHCFSFQFIKNGRTAM